MANCITSSRAFRESGIAPNELGEYRSFDLPAGPYDLGFAYRTELNLTNQNGKSILGTALALGVPVEVRRIKRHLQAGVPVLLSLSPAWPLQKSVSVTHGC